MGLLGEQKVATFQKRLQCHKNVLTMKKVPHFRRAFHDCSHQMIIVLRSLVVTRMLSKFNHWGIIFSQYSFSSKLYCFWGQFIFDIYLMSIFFQVSHDANQLIHLAGKDQHPARSDWMHVPHLLCSGTKTACLGPGNIWQEAKSNYFHESGSKLQICNFFLFFLEN